MQQNVENIYTTVERIIALHEKYQKSYFWSASGTNAAGRRRNEFSDKYEFVFGGRAYKIEQTLQISCRNYYYRLSVVVDGKRSDVRALKKILKENE